MPHKSCLTWLPAVWTLITFSLVLAAFHRDGSTEPLSENQKIQTVYQMYANYKHDFPQVIDIKAKEVMQLLTQNKKVVLVDVRTPEEQRVSMLPGAITQEEFLRRLDSYHGHVIIGYCTISYRSGKLAQELRQQGITMLNLQGGLLAWLHEGGQVFSRGLETSKVHVYGPKWDLSPARYQTVKRRMSLW